MRQTNYPERIALRAAPDEQAVLEQIIKSGKASNKSDAIRYCIKQTGGKMGCSASQ